MKFPNVIWTLITVLTVVKCYEVECDSKYKIEENDQCLKILEKNKISLSLFKSLNPDMDCENLTSDTEICLDGKIKYSTDGTCGPNKGSCPQGQCCSKNGYCGLSQIYCDVGCNPKYGTCNTFNKQIFFGTEQSDVNNYSTIAIHDIINVLSLNESDAKEFFDTANEAMAIYEDAYIDSVDANLSVDECKNKCNLAHKEFENFLSTETLFNIELYNKYLEKINQPSISNDILLELCLNKCYIIEEINEYMKEDQSDEENQSDEESQSDEENQNDNEEENHNETEENEKQNEEVNVAEEENHNDEESESQNEEESNNNEESNNENNNKEENENHDEEVNVAEEENHNDEENESQNEEESHNEKENQNDNEEENNNEKENNNEEENKYDNEKLNIPEEENYYKIENQNEEESHNDEKNQNDNEEEIASTKSKRSVVCEDPNKAHFVKSHFYKNGYHRFRQDIDSVETALSKVNGCSIPVIKDKYNGDDAGIFVPACNSHDICYGCQKGKEYCDKKFLENMKNICKNLRDDSLSCKLLAETFYTAVKIGAQKNYDACKDNEVKTTCAYCGAPLIQNELLLRPFYT